MMLWLSVVVLALAGSAVAFGAVYLADLITRSKRHRVQGTPADLGLRFEEVQFLTADRLTLRGWYLEAHAARGTIVLVHDLEGTRACTALGLPELQRDYVRRGFSVFAFDLRGHGESAGRRDTLGRDERLDVLAAVAWVRRRTHSMQPVLLHGFGFGGALAIAASARSTDVAAVIADSAFLTMREYLRLRWHRVPTHVLSLATFCARRVYKADVDALQPVRAMAQITAPVLLIHNEGDPLVPRAHALNLAAASLDGRDEVWIVPDGTGHATAYRDVPDAYVLRCLQFVEQVAPARAHPTPAPRIPVRVLTAV